MWKNFISWKFHRCNRKWKSCFCCGVGLNKSCGLQIDCSGTLSSAQGSVHPIPLWHPHHEMDAMRKEITRFTQTVETLKKDTPRHRNHSYASEGDMYPVRPLYDWPPSLHPFGENPLIAQCGRDLSPVRQSASCPRHCNLTVKNLPVHSVENAKKLRLTDLMAKKRSMTLTESLTTTSNNC